MPHRADTAGLAEHVEHGGVGELVVLESWDFCRGPVEEEPGFVERGVCLEDLVDGEGVPADGEGLEVGLGGRPRGGSEDGGDVVDCGAHVGFRWRVWGWVGFGFGRFLAVVGAGVAAEVGEGAAMGGGIGH